MKFWYLAGNNAGQIWAITTDKFTEAEGQSGGSGFDVVEYTNAADSTNGYRNWTKHKTPK